MARICLLFLLLFLGLGITAQGELVIVEAGTGLSTPSASPSAPRRAAKATPAAPIYVFVNETGSRYHREACRTLEKPAKKILLDAASAKKYWPCHVCRPPILPRVKK